MTDAKMSKKRVGIVGTGMAGLVTAYLLQNDSQQRYECILFEQGSKPALDAASLSITDPRTGKPERIDLPMRTFAGGYYRNLRAMYNYLKIPYHAQRFNYSFTRSSTSDSNPKQETISHFIHASNLHKIPPPKPAGLGRISWMLGASYLLICYSYFTLCCWHIPPKQGSASSPYSEPLQDYLSRIHLPRHFVKEYLVPLLASVGTCTHEELLRFPACDIVGYKRQMRKAQHYVVSDGVKSVQDRLLSDLDVRLNSPVTRVERRDGKLHVETERDHANGKGDDASVIDNEFDLVILAVPTNIVGRVYSPLAESLSQVPTRAVRSSVHKDIDAVLEDTEHATQLRLQGTNTTHSIHLRTQTNTHPSATETLHVLPTGHVIATRVLANDSEVGESPPMHNGNEAVPPKPMQSNIFYRVLRTPESRAAINKIFASRTPDASQQTNGDAKEIKEKQTRWSNGDEGVYLVGGWAWDGMVLLEGCVVSAMRVARALNVSIPWEV